MRELPIAASAVKFCANLFREVNHFDRGVAEQKVHEESEKAAEICHKILTGGFGPRPNSPVRTLWQISAAFRKS